MKMAMFNGAIGQELTETLKRNLIEAVNAAIENDKVTNFYFVNEEQENEEEEEKRLWELLKKRQEISEYIVGVINDYKQEHKETEIKTSIIIGRLIDTNYNDTLYDEVIQGYYIYGDDLEDDDALDAYSLRNKFLDENMDIIYWYSDPVLNCKSYVKGLEKLKFV